MRARARPRRAGLSRLHGKLSQARLVACTLPNVRQQRIGFDYLLWSQHTERRIEFSRHHERSIGFQSPRSNDLAATGTGAFRHHEQSRWTARGAGADRAASFVGTVLRGMDAVRLNEHGHGRVLERVLNTEAGARMSFRFDTNGCTRRVCDAYRATIRGGRAIGTVVVT
jgi:hypothetical protein